jgi:chromosomal replication initiation ATPase DnaA
MITTDKIGAIVDIVCEQYNVSVIAITSRNRQSNIREARQLTMHFIHKYTGLSLQKSARIVSRDHTTLIHANKVIDCERATNKKYNQNYTFINALIKNKING